MIWYNKQTNAVMEALGTSKEGLTENEFKERLGQQGKNKLEEKRGKSFFEKIIEQISDFMVLTLLAAAAISFFISSMHGERDYLDPIIILAIVVINATIGVVQESRAEKAIEALKKLSAPHARVRRDGKVMTVDCEDIVRGDILVLETGDYIPADARIIECTNLKTEESSLTGESLPQDKHNMPIMGEVHIADQHNMLFASTLVVSGRAEAVVVETGMDTQVGKIAKLIIEDEEYKTPLQERLAGIGKTLGVAALVICGLIFIMGSIQKMPVFDMFMTSVSLAVAAIPEGLPAIVTIVLAIGVQRMSKQNAIIRKLPAVETLGSATVICSDKTGTLTQNKIKVVQIECDASAKALSLAALCCNGTDPTERAILAKAGRVEKAVRVKEIPFDSARKLMTVVVKRAKGYRVITKGAPDVLIDKCDASFEDKKYIMNKNDQMAQKALRVLGVAYKDVDKLTDDLESHLTFAGLIGTADPIRPEAKEAVRICKRAGIKTVMITGDHITTACAIASELGIMRGGDLAITGVELAKLPQSRLERDIYKYSVFARVSPEDKLRIVKAFQAKGAIVAMTGDGVNDAPALQTADIGCAMGVCGTEVAKSAADMILADDNFSTIVEAVKQGRGIYDNIRKAVHFLLSSNVGEIITIFTAIFLGWPSPLLAIQLLWVNLVTDSLPAISLGVDDIDDDIMRRKPKNPKSGLFSDGLGLTILLEGFVIGIISLLAYNIGFLKYNLVTGRTMAFAVLSLSQLVHSFDVRSEKSIFETGIFANMYLLYSFIICTGAQVLVIGIPFLAKLFKVVPLTLSQWLVVAALSLVPLLISEIQKAFARKKQAVGLFGYENA
ncbi:MAG: calcium-translocating P-type ATPase, PMCA-type [Eubacteriales bacterium]|jgi:Ca2+-transporting ATPase|nr:calcium-translocating P-type ATPase, PMCA-type [Eubacteriales bacterium]